MRIVGPQRLIHEEGLTDGMHLDVYLLSIGTRAYSRPFVYSAGLCIQFGSFLLSYVPAYLASLLYPSLLPFAFSILHMRHSTDFGGFLGSQKVIMENLYTSFRIELLEHRDACETTRNSWLFALASSINYVVYTIVFIQSVMGVSPPNQMFPSLHQDHGINVSVVVYVDDIVKALAGKTTTLDVACDLCEDADRKNDHTGR